MGLRKPITDIERIALLGIKTGVAILVIIGSAVVIHGRASITDGVIKFFRLAREQTSPLGETKAAQTTKDLSSQRPSTLTGNNIDDPAHRRRTVLHSTRAANNFDPLDIAGHNHSHVAGSRATAIKQDQRVAEQITRLGIGAKTTDGNGGQSAGIFLNVADPLLGQQIAQIPRRRCGNLFSIDDRHTDSLILHFFDNSTGGNDNLIHNNRRLFRFLRKGRTTYHQTQQHSH